MLLSFLDVIVIVKSEGDIMKKCIVPIVAALLVACGSQNHAVRNARAFLDAVYGSDAASKMEIRCPTGDESTRVCAILGVSSEIPLLMLQCHSQLDGNYGNAPKASYCVIYDPMLLKPAEKVRDEGKNDRND